MRAIFVLCILPLIAQTPKGSYSLSGVVTNAQTGEPIKGALVTLTEIRTPATAQHKPTAPFTAFALAGIGGDFQFTGLSEGHYRLAPEKPGFMLNLASNKPFELTSSMTDIRLKLSPWGAIEGSVVDQYGEPVRRVNVVAIRVRIADGRRVTSSDRSVSTDDQGHYRMWNLPPAKYYLKAAGKSGGTTTYVGDNATVLDSWESFSPVYSGGAHDLDSATPVEITSGAQAQADLTLTLEPAVKIRGALGNFVPHLTAKFELLRGGDDVAASRVTLNGTNGRFEIQDVTPGTYTLRVTQNAKARAEATVTVSGRDVNDVALYLAPGVTVKGLVHALGAPRPEVGDLPSQALIARMPASCNVTLYGSEQPKVLTLEPNGNLTGEDVLPGEYQLAMQCYGGYVTSAISGNVDLLSTPRLTVQPGVAPPRIEITMMHGGGTLKGKLALDPPQPHASILLVPMFSGSTGPLLLPVYEDEGTVKFQFNSLAPGDYTAYAFSRQDDVEYRNPLFLQSLTGGTNVKMDATGDQEITLKSVIK